jgi:hypothetical protein
MQTNTPPPSPITDHHRQIIWQIWVPLIIAIIGMITLAVLAVMASSGNMANSLHWANISMVFLILPGLALAGLLIIFTSLVIYLIARLLGIIPLQALRLQTWFYQAAILIHSWSNKLIEPLLKIHSTSAAGKTVLQKTGIISKSTDLNKPHQPTSPMIGKSK